MQQSIVNDLGKNRAAMDAALYRPDNPDMHLRQLRVYGREAAVYYADGLVSADLMQRDVLRPLMALRDAPVPDDPPRALANAVSAADAALAGTVPEAVTQVMNGRAVLLVEGMAVALGFDARFSVRRGIAPPLTETVVMGPHQGFNESLRDCVTLLRRILPTPELIGDMRTVGERYPTSICILHLAGVADADMLQRVEARLDGIRAAQVLSIGALSQLLEDRPFSLLPQFVLTERPDRAASMLLEGQIVILMEGSSQALVLPASILHLLHTPDDTSARWQYGTFQRLLRIGGMLLSLVLPGLFAALVTFHPEALPVTLMTSVLESQASAPLSIPAEAFLMLVMFSLIGEAATRVPSTVGATLGTVSGLILGSAAVDAGLTHPLMLIVVAVASLGSYAVPDYALGVALRIGQLILLAAGCVFGVYGVLLGLMVGSVRLCSLTSLGAPFMAPLSPHRRHNPDLLTRMPIWRQRRRTWLGSPQDGSAPQAPMRSWSQRR
ncbi:MAG: spore germination protein [Clostridia bacterium]|nr:spore germination protein [Clostridia bacterium]